MIANDIFIKFIFLVIFTNGLNLNSKIVRSQMFEVHFIIAIYWFNLLILNLNKNSLEKVI
jgi:hypothetical protein